MAISKEIINTITKNLKEEQINVLYYEQLDNVLNEVLDNIKAEKGLQNDVLTCLFTGDHMLDTNLGNNSPITYFVAYKGNKQKILEQQSMQNLKKRLKKSIIENKKNNITNDKAVAQLIFNKLITYFDNTSRLYIKDNVIVLNIENEVRAKIIIGYNFDNPVEYNYLDGYFKEDLLKFVTAINKKEDATKNFKLMIKFLKSIELELINKNFLNIKLHDKLNFYEHLIYNVPNELLKGEFDEAYIKTLNYLANANLLKFVLAGSDKFMFEKNTAPSDRYKLYEAKALVKAFIYFYQNFKTLY